MNDVIDALKSNDYDKIENMMFDSPSGDGYGLDNRCINFTYNEEVMDLDEILDELKRLKNEIDLLIKEVENNEC